MRVMLIGTMIAAVAAVSGCERLGLTRKPTSEQVLPFRAAMKQDRDGGLEVSVRADGAGVNAVRESVRFPVTRHCLLNRGSSVADWDIDPATGDWAAVSDGKGTLTFRARCRA